MPFDPHLAATRFGTGLSPIIEPPADVPDMLARLTGPDLVAERLPISGFAQTVPTMGVYREAAAATRKARNETERARADDAARMIRVEMGDVQRHFAATELARGVVTQDGLRERLVAFWADHFTIKSRNFFTRHLIATYAEDAIRPHVAGRFGDMVTAVVTHPLMLMYLEQVGSVGPESKQGQRLGRGLNENLARELLELHLVGVDGGYTQADVTQLAELLTGLTFDYQKNEVRFRNDWAEPGAEVVMGRRYGADASLETVRAALLDLSTRPEVARHLAHKLAVHFVSMTPDQDLVAQMADAFVATGGDLGAVTAAMLDHPAAWDPTRSKVRRPDLFITASLRALGVRADRIMALSPRDLRRHVIAAQALMGQPYQSPVGPDGWSEDPEDWITPQGLAGRIGWALRSPAVFVDALPDPRAFVTTALGPAVPPEVAFAAKAAESPADGVGIILTSPAFQRI